MQPNDLPIVCLPMDLSDEAAAAVVDFLHELTEALERHYCAQLLRHAHAMIGCLRYRMTIQPRPTSILTIRRSEHWSATPSRLQC